MITLRFLVRVPPEKRQELVQSLSSFIPEKSARPCRRLLFQELNDENLVCWVGEWQGQAELDLFLASETYRALKGAATVLGHLEEVRLVEAPDAPEKGTGE
jgi:quinol monooxygenase YgiN